jgi:hypothetical protein
MRHFFNFFTFVVEYATFNINKTTTVPDKIKKTISPHHFEHHFMALAFMEKNRIHGQCKQLLYECKWQVNSWKA